MTTHTFPNNILFESEAFVVIGNDNIEDPVYEVAQKITKRISYLYDTAARELLLQTRAWQVVTPTADEVDMYLDQLTWLGNQALAIH